jgi:hypothetical protein
VLAGVHGVLDATVEDAPASFVVVDEASEVAEEVGGVADHFGGGVNVTCGNVRAGEVGAEAGGCEVNVVEEVGGAGEDLADERDV